MAAGAKTSMVTGAKVSTSGSRKQVPHDIQSEQDEGSLQGSAAHNSVEWFVFTVFCFVTTFCNCARGFYYSGYAVMSCNFWGML